MCFVVVHHCFSKTVNQTPVDSNLAIKRYNCTVLFNFPWHFLAGVNLFFVNMTPSVDEGDSASLCVEASAIIPFNQNIDFSILSSDGTANGGSGEKQTLFMPWNMYSFLTDYEFVNLTSGIIDVDSPTCFDVVTTGDDEVEGNEMYTISLTSNSTIASIDEPVLQIIIKDDDCKHWYV